MEEREKVKLTQGEEEVQMSPLKILKNLVVLGFAFMFLFTAFKSIANLQSSLNKDDNVGTGGLSIVYGAFVISCMFIPPWLINVLGCKWAIAASMICFIVYMAAQFYATWGIIAPASVILGVGAAPLWTAQSAYLTQIGGWYSQITKTNRDDVINRFFGVFFMFFQTSQVWGNLVSSEVLAADPDTNLTVDCGMCGANWCPWYENKTTVQPAPDIHKIYLILGLYLASACIAFLIIAVFLDNIQLEKQNKGQKSSKLLVETFRHFLRSPSQKLLVPLSIYSGLDQAFVAADYTKSFITCPIGVWNVGFAMICFGVTDAVCSLTFGRLVQYMGQIIFFVLAALVHLGVLIALLFWAPDPEGTAVFYLIPALWGMGDAVWQTQVNALHGSLFRNDSEAAFANFRLWQSLGFIIAFAYAGALCTQVKIYVSIGILVAGMLGYAAVEINQHRGKSHDLYPER